ncbi:hypothetical protein GOP47_0016243 [Adiantum capillus-veneris]|uniref:Uncharacterized protein n=1 Tax=Adiantum capillus-veneris TaxID=13818 RepID=A0A9D4ZA40_ADICA|nr:hypothetical protein GOP47_0016243 [Adiantum capillus-veneris]
MGKLTWVMVLVLIFVVAFATETPQFTTVHTESSFEIRLYRPMAWMTAPILHQSSFQHATLMGSHKLFQYIQGANMNFSRIPLSFPVLTDLHLKAEHWDSVCVAVRKFSGFVVDENIGKEASMLESSLRRSPWANATFGMSTTIEDAYTIAQYNLPFKHRARVNEVWVTLSGPYISDKCEISTSTYTNEFASTI